MGVCLLIGNIGSIASPILIYLVSLIHGIIRKVDIDYGIVPMMLRIIGYRNMMKLIKY